ncbi:MAG: hypothetical protein M1815_002452 [Lichina confinis]|nr:MAG: hypothetical protein M1815_002452 [Lichina confinis]
MSQPTPPVPLEDHCSVVYNHTLYVYSPEGFQSLDLSENATWVELPLDVAARGAACVKAIPEGDDAAAALYVVGGAVDDSPADYPGLMRYLFANGSWAPVEPTDRVTKNRRNHGAVYLNSSSAILTYAGSQDTAEATPSSQTFLLSVTPPYTVTSFSSEAPPLVRPQLLQWNETHAAMVGGSDDNIKVFTFSQEGGWADTGFTLDEPLPDDTKAQSVVVDQDDGEKALLTFDLSTSPNEVRRVVLRISDDDKGSSVRRRSQKRDAWPAAEPSVRPPPARRRRRKRQDAADENGGDANTVPAPTSVRTGFSLAQGSNGKVVISGGNEQEPISIFDAGTNNWLNATELLGGSQDSTDDTASPTSSSLPSPPSPTESADTEEIDGGAASPNSGRDRALTILGATLGGIVGIALLLVCALIFVRWRRKKRTYVDGRHGKGGPGNEKDRLSFADRGASFMSQAAGAPGHGYKDSNSSAAIMLGPTSRGPEIIMRPGVIPEPGMRPPERALIPIQSATTTTRDGLLRPRSSGWSRYFLGNTATDLSDSSSAGGGSSSNTPGAPSQQPRAVAVVDSLTVPERTIRPSTEGQPINFSRSYPSQRLNRRTGDTAAGGRIESLYIQRLDSSSSEGSSRSPDGSLTGPPPPGAHEDTGWSPVAREEWSSGRAASSIYTNSAHNSGLPRDFNPALFPQVPRSSTATTFPGAGGVIAPAVLGAGDEGAVDDRGTSAGTAMAGYDPQRRNSGMSWLNLGEAPAGGERVAGAGAGAGAQADAGSATGAGTAKTTNG